MSSVLENDLTKVKTNSLDETTCDAIAPEIKLVPNEVSGPVGKTSMRTRSRPSNKSVLQSAIARKEKSLHVDDRPRLRQRRIKPKVSDAHSDEESISIKKMPPLKRINNTPSITVKKNPVIKSSSHLCDKNKTDLTEGTSLQAVLADGGQGVPELVLQHKCATMEHYVTARLCKCTENKNLFVKNGSGSQFCTAIDAISDKLIGCTKLVDVEDVPIFRPSTRIPFGVFCESHRKRLIRHNCCPTCGVFCTQGTFSECPSKHHFHKDCKIFKGKNAYCPHCGDSAPSSNILISMHLDEPPIFLPVQRSLVTAAKISFNTPQEAKPNTPRIASFSPFSIPSERMEELNEVVNIEMDECNQMGLCRAIDVCDARKVSAILKIGNINVNAPLEEYNNGTLLHLAVLKGNLDIIYLLIMSKIDLDSLNNDQNSPLMCAISEGRNDIVKHLVQAGAEVSLKGMDAMTSLHLAAKFGNLEACNIVLCNAVMPNFVNVQDDGGWTALVWACEHGYKEVVKYLLSMGADISIRDVEHNVALHWAAFKGSTEIVELLLNLKTDIDVTNVHGDTPLHISAREDHYNCVILLLSRKADITIVNRNSETPLDSAPKDGLCAIPLGFSLQLALSNNSRRTHLLTNDISRGREVNPVQCWNGIDSEEEPRSYDYIKKSCVSSDNVRINTKITNLQYCSCQDRCRSSKCKCAKLSLKCWYDDRGKLLPDFNFDGKFCRFKGFLKILFIIDPPLIFECNDLCSCNSILCSNRLVQKPSTQRFQLFKTEFKGWGIKTLNFIAAGSFVCEYVGEILTDSEADLREDDSYLFDLDNRETDSFCIDAKFYGNFSRFINHSCLPNLYPIKVFIDHHDLRFPRIALFSKRDIAANEELSFDYGDKFWLVKCKLFTCHCGTEQCKYSKETIKMRLLED
ncbi:histone-lysine N-methyltransferase EHMT1 isoform X1 [Euwallacea similis]|uniref:histone-lysine N-methyltransferase EHMT1 isoform X1 n=1 Tax=Euwallacea similis TaxID=1736056 RepID=UPI00344E1B0C